MTEEEMQKAYDEYEKKVKEAEEEYNNSPTKARWTKAEGPSLEVSAEVTGINVGLTGVKVSASGLSTGIYGISENFKGAAGKTWGCYFAPSISDSKLVTSEMELDCTDQEAEMIENAQNVCDIMDVVSILSQGAIKLKN